jgi:hypothetical protein
LRSAPEEDLAVELDGLIQGARGLLGVDGLLHQFGGRLGRGRRREQRQAESAGGCAFEHHACFSFYHGAFCAAGDRLRGGCYGFVTGRSFFDRSD